MESCIKTFSKTFHFNVFKIIICIEKILGKYKSIRCILKIIIIYIRTPNISNNVDVNYMRCEITLVNTKIMKIVSFKNHIRMSIVSKSTWNGIKLSANVSNVSLCVHGSRCKAKSGSQNQSKFFHFLIPKYVTGATFSSLFSTIKDKFSTKEAWH